MTDATLQQNMERSRKAHLIPGREIHMKSMRAYRFCEVGLITGTTKENTVANIWNTTGVFDPTPEQFAALDADKLAKDTHSMKVWLNPVRHIDRDLVVTPRQSDHLAHVMQDNLHDTYQGSDGGQAFSYIP